MKALPGPPRVEAAAALGRELRHVGYTQEALARLGLDMPWTYLPAYLPLALARLEEGPDDPLRYALEAFFLSTPVSREQLGGPLWQAARDARILTASGRSPFVIQPYRGCLLASDPMGPRGNRLRGPRLPVQDRVFPVDASTHLLAQSLVPPWRAGLRALDIGCGTGIMAFLLLRRYADIQAVDLNPRCIAMDRFNAALNGVDSILWRHGDLFAPVQGQRFDHVVANLPYVPTPDRHALYWDGGRRGHDIASRLVAALPEVLERGGFAQFSVGWPNPGEEDFLATLDGWMGGAKLSALVLYGTPQPMEQTIPLLATSEADPHEAGYAEAVARWRNAARQAGLKAIAPAVVTMRNDGLGMRLGLPMRRSRDDFGPAIWSLFETWAWLAAHPPEWETWARQVLRPAGAVTLGTETRFNGEDWLAGASRWHFEDRPWTLPAPLGRDSAAVLQLCDGLRPLADVVFAFCARTGRDPHQVRDRLLQVLPGWLQHGLLEPRTS
ncbi:MAG: methyltransferase [Candidatus Xenobia bacterium]